MTLIDREQASIIFKATSSLIYRKMKDCELFTHYGTEEMFKTVADLFIGILDTMPAVMIDEETGEYQQGIRQESLDKLIDILYMEKLNE